jgi:hypothetical protein
MTIRALSRLTLVLPQLPVCHNSMVCSREIVSVDQREYVTRKRRWSGDEGRPATTARPGRY